MSIEDQVSKIRADIAAMRLVVPNAQALIYYLPAQKVDKHADRCVEDLMDLGNIDIEEPDDYKAGGDAELTLEITIGY